MAKLIQAKYLNTKLWRPGPYIYFFDERCHDKNSEMIEYVNILANMYKRINVFKIAWEDRINRTRRHIPYELNKLYLYYEGNKILEHEISDKENINKIFFKAVDCYNKNIEKKADSIGKHPRKRFYFIENKNINGTSIYNNNIKRKKKFILNKKIRNVEEGNVKIQLAINEFNNKECIKKQIKNKIITKIFNKEIHDKTKSQIEWYRNVQMTTLPLNIFSNESFSMASKNDINNEKRKYIN